MKQILSATIILGLFGLTGTGCVNTISQDHVYQTKKVFTFERTIIDNTKGVGRKKDTLSMTAILVTPLPQPLAKLPTDVRANLLAKK